MKVRISDPAKKQARAISRRWRKRPAAPKLFAQEMSAARHLLALTPELGTPYVERDGVLVRRVLLRKTQNHVHYELNRSRAT